MFCMKTDMGENVKLAKNHAEKQPDAQGCFIVCYTP